MDSQRAGVVLATGQGLHFIPVDVVVTIEAAQVITPVPGLRAPAVGLTLADDRVVTVLEIGHEAKPDLVVCRVEGNWVGLGGGRVLSSGVFSASPSLEPGVIWNGQQVPLLDVRALCASAEQSIWQGRALRNDRDEARQS